MTPSFPFGHGLSYSTFDYSGLQATPQGVDVRVTNNGTRAASEVVQLYVGFPKVRVALAS